MHGSLGRAGALEAIRKNIASRGFHTYVITGAKVPNYTYTIGLSPALGSEIVLAGAYYYRLDELSGILNAIAEQLRAPVSWETRRVELNSSWGAFSFRKIHPSWEPLLIGGALDFYQVKEVSAFQVLPDDVHWTIGIPNLSVQFSPKTVEAGWRWLKDEWPYSIPQNSVALTNLDALRGTRITEAARWEEDQWELFAGAGPDIPDHERRVVPLGMLLEADRSLSVVVNLKIGAGVRRDEVSEWQPWA